MSSLSAEEQRKQLQAHQELCLQRTEAESSTNANRCTVTWDGLMCWDSVSAGTIAEQQCPGYVNGMNAAAVATRTCLANATWKSKPGMPHARGWTNFTQCLASLPDVTDVSDTPDSNVFKEHLSQIMLMSEICYGISLVALIVAVVIMVTSNYGIFLVALILAVVIMITAKRLHCKSNSLHINLFLAFILRASVSILRNHLFVNGVGLEKDVVRKEPEGVLEFRTDISHWECKLLMTVFMYSIAVSMMWIFMEGLYLYMLVRRTLFTDRHGVKMYIFIGWFGPLLFIIPWVLVRIYFDDMLCWNVYTVPQLRWIVDGPTLCTIVLNFVFFIDIIRVLCVRATLHSRPVGSSDHVRKIAKFVFALVPLFGVVYIGFAAYPQGFSETADMVYIYCEMFYNSIQGFVLALLLCFLNEDVNAHIRKWISGRVARMFGVSADRNERTITTSRQMTLKTTST